MNSISIKTGDRVFEANLSEPLHISIPLDFDGGAQPNAYGVERAASKACEAGSLVGDTRRGGSCNFERVTFIPHCNGTHTEAVGHITHERISVNDCLQDAFIPATVLSVEPENAFETKETYAIDLSETDKLITRKSIENAINKVEARVSARAQMRNLEVPLLTRGLLPLNETALIIRTLPNDESKKSRTYLEEIPPFFSSEAMEFIVSNGIKHLLCDLPSIDRIFDQGKLSNHRIFWNIEQNAFQTNEKSRTNCTITELIYVLNEIADGNYLLNLQIAPFASDAAPSRPVLFALI